jgi:hypothetical protein
VTTYRLRDIVDNNRAVRIAVVHGREGLVSFLAGGIPNLKFHSRSLIKGDRLGQESSTDGRFAERVELILLCFVSREPDRFESFMMVPTHLDESQDDGTLVQVSLKKSKTHKALRPYLSNS